MFALFIAKLFLSRSVYFANNVAYIYWPSASLHTLARKLQTIQYLARSKVVQAETRELASLTRGKIKPGEKDEWLNEQLYVPPLPPTNLRGCNLIRIQYDVYVSKNTECMLGAFPLAFTHKICCRKHPSAPFISIFFKCSLDGNVTSLQHSLLIHSIFINPWLL